MHRRAAARAGQSLRPGEKTQARRRVCCTNYHVIEGAGYSMVGGQRLDWEDMDVFTMPTWTFCEHVNNGDRPACLFRFSDEPVIGRQVRSRLPAGGSRILSWTPK